LNDKRHIVGKGIRLDVLGWAQVDLADGQSPAYQATENYLEVRKPFRSPGKHHTPAGKCISHMMN